MKDKLSDPKKEIKPAVLNQINNIETRKKEEIKC